MKPTTCTEEILTDYECGFSFCRNLLILCTTGCSSGVFRLICSVRLGAGIFVNWEISQGF